MPRVINLRFAAYLLGTFVAGSGILRLASAAFAVVETPMGSTSAAPTPSGGTSKTIELPSPAPLLLTPANESAAPTPQAVVRIDLPVSWQLTRAGSGRSRATTQTESFRETWTLELRSGRTYFLQSPRARVEVFATSDEAAPTAGSSETAGDAVIPKAVVLAERDFARLVGVSAEPKTEDGDVDPEVAVDLERPITLPLSRAGRASTDVSLIWSDDEHYAVHIDVGSSVLF